MECLRLIGESSFLYASFLIESLALEQSLNPKFGPRVFGSITIPGTSQNFLFWAEKYREKKYFFLEILDKALPFSA